MPRSHVYRLIRSGQVRVNSGRVNPKYRLRAGDRVRVPPVATDNPKPLASKGDSLAWLEGRIVFEDNRLLVLDKPAGLAVHGGSGVSLGCIEALRALRPELPELELAHRSGSRAPRDACSSRSGAAPCGSCTRLLREGRVEKRYLTLVQGRWPEGVTEIEAPLLTRRPASEARVRVDATGKAAQSSFRLLETYGKTASLLEVAIATGRTHQIRVHAAHRGHPVAGDDRYGDPEFNSSLAGLGLAAHVPACAFRRVRMARERRALRGERSSARRARGTSYCAGRAAGDAASGSSPAALRAPASQISGKPISAVGSAESMRSNRATPSRF